jgi:uncharacterized protein (TIGR03437 family)
MITSAQIVSCYTPGMALRVVPALFLAAHVFAAPQQSITPQPFGPFHVSGNRILDSRGRPFLMRGTQLTEFHLKTVALDNRGGRDYGPHSATSLSAIRLRFNMNTVRLPLDARESTQPGFFPALARTVRRANTADLMVVLAARNADAAYWRQCAAYFKDYPNVMFDLLADANSTDDWDTWRTRLNELARVVRETGAKQPVIAMSWNAAHDFAGAPSAPLLDDPNTIYEVAPTYPSGDRQKAYGDLAAGAPVTANGWDIEIADTSACTQLPSDPSAVTAMIRANLDDFDARGMSWTASVYEAGKLIKDYSLQDATSLEDGWTCGQVKYPPPGIGRIVEGHLRGVEERGLFVVSAAGGIDLARDGFAIAYGPVLAARDSMTKSYDLPFSLGKVSVQITDSKGVTRPARLFWASAGWGQINFVVPADSALGPARMTIVRQDGSRTNAQVTVVDTAPGFWTGVSCRGPAEGEAVQTYADGRTVHTALSVCDKKYGDCRTVQVPLADGAVTLLKLHASGFRHATSPDKVEVRVAGRRLHVVSFGASGYPGTDVVTVEVPSSLRGIGETDLMCHVNGRVSNAVRIRI